MPRYIMPYVGGPMRWVLIDIDEAGGFAHWRRLDQTGRISDAADEMGTERTIQEALEAALNLFNAEQAQLVILEAGDTGLTTLRQLLAPPP